MDKFVNQIFFDNSVRSYFLVFALILFVILLRRIIAYYSARLIFIVIHRAWKKIDRDRFIELLVPPLGIFFIILTSVIAFHTLVFPRRFNIEIYTLNFREIVHSVGTIIIIVSFVWLLLRMIEFIAFILEQKANLTPDPTDNQLIVFFKDFFKVLIGIMGTLMILHFTFNFRLGNLITGLSLIGAAIALALRESIENLIASFIIFFDKPFTTGDQVKVHQVTGNVERIGLRSTRLRTEQKTFVTVPNKQMVDTILDNHSLRTQRKGELNLQIDLATPSKTIENFISATYKILDRKEVENCNVLFNDITAQAFVIYVEYFTSVITTAEFNAIRQQINMKVLKLLEELKIDIAGASNEVRIISQT